MMSIVRYTADRAQEWDNFIEGSRNGTFLFLRGYMDYHSDRFTDHSLMYYNEKGRLVAVMAGNEVELCKTLHNTGKVEGKVLYSHQGLTYGGFVLAPKVHITEVGEMFDATMDYLRHEGFAEWYYKQIPAVYHKLPSEDDEYWLWRRGAVLEVCNMMTAIALNNDIDVVSQRKKTYCNKLMRQGYDVLMDCDVSLFWPLLEANLKERFDAKPVHSLAEIMLLKKRFPDYIVCCAVRNPLGEVIAGTLLFITDTVVRTQYISASHVGKQTNALDYLMLSLVAHYRKNQQYRFFEFGTSMAEDGVLLNDGLILQKEGFGGRSVACKTWKVGIRA